MIEKMIETVAVDMHCTGVLAGQKARPARGTDRALAIGVSKSYPFGNEPIDDGSINVVIPQSIDRIIALLIGADPEDIGPLIHGRNCSTDASRHRNCSEVDSWGLNACATSAIEVPRISMRSRFATP